ncbi:DUF2066 domain-containing protein [Shewanella sp. 10N.286.52.B9]|uniref:DUF2066 domain-containing protein n=1 Tax=Shewanella sp. 10N.286.52.B9 TaxID=1880837 RepID=UPI000C822680|nr:DUF2066 domain-containing protein [Shewanella sp. 10N.286.52.B9]PMG49494.1 hypothetical protein BCU91_18355 [Shewanella sp. 10N.286.52.B9]
MLKLLIQFIVIGCVFALNSFAVIAAEIALLDEADVVVTSRATNERQVALKQALSTVFIKNSGLTSVLEHPLIKSHINKPESLLTQYGYSQVDDELVLKANFDHKRIISALREAELPVWGRQRPSTLLWMSIENAGDRAILADAAESDIRTQIDLDANNKGIPILLPVMDLDDVMQVNVSDVRGMFADVVANASKRYQADYFAMADIDQVGGFVRFNVALFDKGNASGVMQPLINHQAEVADYEQATDEILTRLAGYFVSQYAFADSGNSAQTKLTLVGVQTMAQLVDIEAYLTQLSAIKSVSLSQFKADIVTYNLSLFGDASDLEKLLSINKRLTQIDTVNTVVPPNLNAGQENSINNVDPNLDSETTVSLIYQWH